MESLLHDLKFSTRMLLKSPAFTIVAILTLGLGIGANSVIFSVINAVLLHPLPFHEPDRLVQLWETEASPGTYPFAGPDYLDWQAQNHTLEATSLYTWGRSFNASGTGQPEPVLALSTQANFFSVLGVQPLLGRSFAPGEDQAGRNRVVVLSYGIWKRRFGGDPGVLGKSLSLDSEPYSVIGVMPQGFRFPAETEIWIPFDMSVTNLGSRGSHSFRALGRLKPGVTVEQSQADLALIARNLERQFPDSNEKVGAAVISMKDQITRASREQLLILFGAVALVLLVACANMANLLLARATQRQREMAVRAALGASRWRVVQQLLTESILLSFLGAAFGLLLSWWGSSLLQSARQMPIPRENDIHVDGPVLLFTLSISLLVGILFGLAPALQASKRNLGKELKASEKSTAGPAGRRRFLRDALVISELALSLALLVGAGLLLRTFARLRMAEIGVQSGHVLTMGINLPDKNYTTPTAQRQFFDRLLERLQQNPILQAASISTQIPLEGGSNGYIRVPGQDNSALKNQLVEYNSITPAYFRAFGIPFITGRNFTPHEIERGGEASRKLDEFYSAPNRPKEFPREIESVAIINRTMARMVWQNQDPIGKLFIIGDVLPIRVIGVVGDVKDWGIRLAVHPQAYFPLTAALGPGMGARLVVKTSGPPRQALGLIRQDIKALDGSLALLHPRTMDEVISGSMQDTNLQTALLSAFAGLATLLASLGLYSVMTYLVTQRNRELGIRLALGAQRLDILRLVVGHGAKLTLLGVGIGMISALALTRLLRNLLYEVSANDSLTFTGVALLLALVALAACYLPARRATRADPMVALRYE